MLVVLLRPLQHSSAAVYCLQDVQATCQLAKLCTGSFKHVKDNAILGVLSPIVLACHHQQPLVNRFLVQCPPAACPAAATVEDKIPKLGGEHYGHYAMRRSILLQTYVTTTNFTLILQACTVLGHIRPQLYLSSSCTTQCNPRETLATLVAGLS